MTHLPPFRVCTSNKLLVDIYMSRMSCAPSDDTLTLTESPPSVSHLGSAPFQAFAQARLT